MLLNNTVRHGRTPVSHRIALRLIASEGKGKAGERGGGPYLWLARKECFVSLRLVLKQVSAPGKLRSHGDCQLIWHHDDMFVGPMRITPGMG